MRVGILGSGDVAKALGRGFVLEGNEVMLGSRAPEKLSAWVDENGTGASSGTFADAAAFGEILVLAVHGVRSVDAIRLAGAESFRSKIVIDATNPLDKSEGLPPKLVGSVGTSGGELNQKALPGAFLVKAFNTVGNSHFYKPDFECGPPDMFICGDDEAAKSTVSRICGDFGWNSVDVGGVGVSHYLEATGMLWISLWLKTGDWDQAFKLIPKRTGAAGSA